MTMQPENTLEIDNLSISYKTLRGDVPALRSVSFNVPRNKTVGIVGESGCGKSSLIYAILQLMAANARVEAGEVRFGGENLASLSQEAMRAMLGERISMVFQDPMTAMNPVIPIGVQMMDALYRRGMSNREKQARVIEMLDLVGIPDAKQRFGSYPHEFSGGMRQRICIAMALMMNPELLIADEPTTALDVTLEAQIMHLFEKFKDQFECSVLFVSHNLGLIAEICDEVVVMYAGEVVERCPVNELFADARHPYTRALLQCDPSRVPVSDDPLPTIEGAVPDLMHLPSGCVFAPRCPHADGRCRTVHPGATAVAGNHIVSCHLAAGGQK